MLMLYYTKTARQILDELGSNEQGLAVSEAEARLKVYGPNTIEVKGDPLWRKLIAPFANIFMLVLFVAVVISLFHHAFFDAIIIAVIMLVSAVIYYIQRFSTERILRSLQKHTAQTIETLRDSKTIELETSQLVPGDIITLNEGEKVPADARILVTESLRVDESQLTGESMPIGKHANTLHGEKEIYEQNNMLFQGSFIVAGEAKAIIISTGNDTEFGKLAALSQQTDVASPVQKKIDRLLAQIIGVVSAIAVIAFGLAVGRGMDITESFRFVLALSVSAVPESLPVAISVILVLGMRRMAAKKALVRTMRSIETIGVITTIATDKTGTLTKNQLTVQETWQPEGTSLQNLVHITSYAINYAARKMHDPLDTAMHMFVETKKTKRARHTPLASLAFDQSVSMSGNVWHNGDSYTLAIKGAPEQVLLRGDLTENEREKANTMLHKLTGGGYRVLAIAHTELQKPIHKFSDLPAKTTLQFDGFLAAADVLRPEAKRAIQTALKAGVTVRMITGDHFETAYHIGKQLGMVQHRSEVFDTRHMSVMSDEALSNSIDSIRVFSRVTPEHKYRILTLLKQKGIAAMTGDGVNDVPALTNAHVGVAMGSGAAIAKDAGDIILLDDNFKSIIDAMREGRTIFANIRRMLFYLLSTNAGEVLTALGALLIGLPVPLAPVQILWVNLVTDSSMVIPLGLEPGEKNNMTKRPNKPGAPILGKFLISRMILVAITIAALTVGLYAYYSYHIDHAYAQTVAFSALVVMQWANALNARSDDESIFSRLRVLNKSFYVGLTIGVSFQALALFSPLGDLLHVAPVAIGDLVIASAIAFVIPIFVVEMHKFIGRRFFGRQTPA